MACVGDSEGGVWERFQGDDWTWEWTTTDDVSTWSDLRVTIRASRSSTATVLATTEAVPATITTTGTNFAGQTLAWQVADTVTDDFPPGACWIEAEVLVGSNVTTILSRSMRVLPQVVTP